MGVVSKSLLSRDPRDFQSAPHPQTQSVAKQGEGDRSLEIPEKTKNTRFRMTPLQENPGALTEKHFHQSIFGCLPWKKRGLFPDGALT